MKTLCLTRVGQLEWEVLSHWVLNIFMIMQCDQYRLVIEDYYKLISCWQRSDNGIAASQYADIKTNKVKTGAPEIFSKLYYDELLLLKEKGVKQLLTKYSSILEIVRIPDAAFDLDTPEDLKHLINIRRPYKPSYFKALFKFEVLLLPVRRRR